MSENKLGVKHNLSLSSRVWGELKLRAVQEKTTVSELVAYVLGRFFSDPPKKIKVSRYQSRKNTDGEREGRTVYIPDSVWLPIEETAKQGRFSVTYLVDVLVKDYLGIEQIDRGPGDISDTMEGQARLTREGGTSQNNEQISIPQEEETSRYLKVGDTIFDLGEDAVSLDLKTGKVTRR